MNYSSEAFDEHYAAAAAAVDESVRQQEFKACQQELTNDAASAYIQDVANIMVYNRKFDGFQSYPLYAVDFSAIYQVQAS